MLLVTDGTGRCKQSKGEGNGPTCGGRAASDGTTGYSGATGRKRGGETEEKGGKEEGKGKKEAREAWV